MKKNSIVTLLSVLMMVPMLAFSQGSVNPTYQLHSKKMDFLLERVNSMYVDTVNFDKLVEKGIVEMLKELDPHSTYVSSKDVQQANEPLEGKFDGIGVTFQLIKDTINIMEVLVGGPSEKVGLLPGDKILKVDTNNATGKGISNSWVQKHLRGKKGTKVEVTVKRGRSNTPLVFTIVRDKIPMNSINVYYMVDDEVGYIRLERFARTSPDEFHKALSELQSQGMKSLIFDLRGNGGGYLDVAFSIADEFVKNGKKIVYTDNFRKLGCQSFVATGNGDFEKGKLVILVDEGTASASEIVSGAVQDWDRGLVVGRRTFGKGLVQKPIYLPDNSMIRLTISHYYTPTGRCIQKPYNDGLDNYFNDVRNRQNHGELLTADSIHFPDSLKYRTPNGRTVYGGGGIMPDIFIPIDTTKYSTLYNEIMRKGVFGNFTMNYMQDHRAELTKNYPTIKEFKRDFVIDDAMYDEFMAFARKEGVKDSVVFNFSKNLETFAKDKKKLLDSLYSYDNVNDSSETYRELVAMMNDFMKESYNKSMQMRNEKKAPEFIKEYLKFEMARTLYGYGSAYEIFLLSDDTFLQAYKIIKDESFFKKHKVDR